MSAPPAPVRVLHVLKFYRPDFTGEGVFLERCSAVMQEQAPEVAHDLLVTRTPGETVQPQDAACSTLARIIYLQRRPTGVLRHHLALIGWFLRNLHRYEAVHVRTHADWYFVTYLLARLAGRRLVLSATLDDSIPVLVSRYRQSFRAFARRGFALFHDYIGISPRLQEENLAAVADPARCHLIPCGITIPADAASLRPAMRARLGVAEQDPVLLFVGGLCERKDPLALIEALPAVRAEAPGARLVLVGPELEPGYVAHLHARVAALGLADAVLFAGRQDDPHPWFAGADILAFASRLEGFGTVVPEAMAHGLPVVVRRLPGVNEDFVVDGETGLAFTDQQGLIAALLALVRDPALRRRIGEAARGLALARFSMDEVAARYLAVYRGQPRPPAAPASAPPAPTGLGAGASVLDRRFHSPVAIPPESQPLLLTMVDAEEAFDWSRPFDRQNTDVRSMAAQALAHRVFERHGVRPLYLADYPVAALPDGRAPLRELIASGVAEVGAQLHPWVTPPFDETVSDHNSFAGNLPTRLQLEKARLLTAMIEEAFGTRPRIWRTGRFGVGVRTADILRALGYAADTSVMPFWPAENCPAPADFWRLSAQPYWLDHERTLMEIPVAATLVGRLAGRRDGSLAPMVFNRGATRLGVTGIAARFGLLERIRLSPEGITIEEAKRLARAMHAAGHRVFVLTYHSPSLVPGNTPYVRTARDLDAFLGWLDAFYAFFREELGGRPGSWEEVRWPGRAAGTTQRAAAD
jgi:glycosyltransferase involved in cell wall biosynthesis